MGNYTALLGVISLLRPVIITKRQFSISYLVSRILLICSLLAYFSLSEHTKDTLVECVSSHIKQRNVASTYGARLDSSSGRILLQSVPGLLSFFFYIKLYNW